MHFLSTALAILPATTALAINNTGSNLETDVYSARAQANQQEYQKENAPESWATCNDTNTVVRKEWYVHFSRLSSRLATLLTQSVLQERTH